MDGGNRMTKRAVVFLSVLLCVALLSSVTALAAETVTYELDALDMSIEIPGNYGTFTRDTPSNDSAYAQFGFTKEQVDGWLTEGNMYLNAIRLDGTHEVNVTMIESPLEDFIQLSDTTLSTLASTWVDMAESAGLTYIKSEIHKHEQVKFVKAYISQPYNDQTVYGLQYYTVCNGQAINITMHSYAGELTEEDESELEDIVDSANFRGAKLMENGGLETKPFAYEDAETGVSFTVPANWVQADLNEERETIDAKFASTQEAGLLILYGSTDMWEQLTPGERLGYERSDLDTQMLSEADMTVLAAGAKMEDAKISTVDYGGKTYFFVEGTCQGEAYGLTMSLPTVILVRVENGYWFQFQFTGAGSDSPYFGDLVQLLNSVRYPWEDSAPSALGAPSAEKMSSSSDASGPNAVIAWTLAAAAVLAMVLFVWRSKAREAKMPKERQNNLETPQGDGAELTPSQSEDCDPPEIRFCHKCGSKLAPGSETCEQCGTQILRRSEVETK